MESKKELRIFIEALIEGEVDYRLAGKTIVTYFNFMFAIYLGLIRDLLQMKQKHSKIKERFKSDIHDLISNNLLDFSSLNLNRISAGIERIKYKYELEEAVPISSFKKLLKSGKEIAGAVAVIVGVVTLLKKAYKDIKKTKDMAERDILLSHTFEYKIRPFLENTLNKILTSTIKDKNTLKREFFKGIDGICSYNFNLRPYLQTWNVQI